MLAAKFKASKKEFSFIGFCGFPMIAPKKRGIAKIPQRKIQI